MAARTSMSREGPVAPWQKPVRPSTTGSKAGASAPVASNIMNPAAVTSPATATISCRRVRSARSPPARMPVAPPTRKAVSAPVASPSGVS